MLLQAFKLVTFHLGILQLLLLFSLAPTPSLPVPSISVLSLNLDFDFSYNASVRSVSPSNFRPTSPAPSVIGYLTRISLNRNPALFSNKLEYLYTGKGFGDAFEFLFDANEKYMTEGEDVSQKYVKMLYICGDQGYTRISSSKYMKMYLP